MSHGLLQRSRFLSIGIYDAGKRDDRAVGINVDTVVIDRVIDHTATSPLHHIAEHHATVRLRCFLSDRGWVGAGSPVALFSKQNTITLAPALVLYHAIVVRRSPMPTCRWPRPYAPYVALTVGYLLLRYVIRVR